jgi:hypothetical protein
MPIYCVSELVIAKEITMNTTQHTELQSLSGRASGSLAGISSLMARPLYLHPCARRVSSRFLSLRTAGRFFFEVNR